MSILQAIILGLIQGASEFAPISSSGHLLLAPWAFGWEIVEDASLNQSFDVALHLGTLLGALIYFRTDVRTYLKAFARSVVRRRIDTADERIAWALVVGTIPGVVVGAAFESVIQEHLAQPWLVIVMLAAFGVVLWAVDARAPQERGFESIGIRTGLFLGLAQAVALQPGVSRSGVTMTAARLIGLDRPASSRFSFLLSMPIIAGAGVYKAADLVRDGFGGNEAAFAWGFVASAVSGFGVIWFLLRYLRSHSFALFLWYRLALAGIATLLLATGVRSATI